jgi:hypothetical protein
MIRIDVHRQNLVSVEYRPSLLRRLLGERPQEGFAVPIPAINGGRMWVWDRSRADVDRGRVHPIIGDAIERELRLIAGRTR